MKKLMLLSFGALALASCAPMMMTPTSYNFSPQTSAPSGVVPVGAASVTKTSTTTSTNIKLTGLAANTYYVGHYHTMGTGSNDPCTSGGMAIMASKMVGQSDATGALTMNGTVANSDIAMATYLNVHTASDAMGTPADNGVACTPVKP